MLRDRVESHEYMNRQLFLATLTFAVLLFLLPTILVYYVVFATVNYARFFEFPLSNFRFITAALCNLLRVVHVDDDSAHDSAVSV